MIVDACAESTLICRDLAPIQDPGAPKTNPRVPSLKPKSSITEQELCKDIPLQQKLLTEFIPITDTEFRAFQINFDYRNRISEFRTIFVIISAPKVMPHSMMIHLACYVL